MSHLTTMQFEQSFPGARDLRARLSALPGVTAVDFESSDRYPAVHIIGVRASDYITTMLFGSLESLDPQAIDVIVGDIEQKLAALASTQSPP